MCPSHFLPVQFSGRWRGQSTLALTHVRSQLFSKPLRLQILQLLLDFGNFLAVDHERLSIELRAYQGQHDTSGNFLWTVGWQSLPDFLHFLREKGCNYIQQVRYAAKEKKLR